MSLEQVDTLELVNKFKGLPRRDRKAIERQLSSAEKEILRQHLNQAETVSKTPKAQEPTKVQSKGLDMKHLSPWLSKHLKKNVFNSSNERDCVVTQATLEALPEIIASAAEAH